MAESAWLAALVGLAGSAVITLVIAIAYFGRDPERKIVLMPDWILSAADGEVSAVKKLTFNDLLEQTGVGDLPETATAARWNELPNFWLVSVFMSVLDVHVNRAPLGGTVTSVVHKLGEFQPLSDRETHNQRTNERNTLFIQGEKLSVAVVQIAGHLARRIVCRVSPGDRVQQGDRVGWIRLGSQVDVIFPALEGTAICVQRGAKAKAGITTLASTNQSERALGVRELVAEMGSSNSQGLKEAILARCLIWVLHAFLYSKLGLHSILHLRERKRSNAIESGGH